MTRLLPLIIASLAVSGCAASTPNARVDASRSIAPANLTTTCDPLPRLGKPAPMGALLEYSDMVVGMYGECARRDRAKAEYIKSMHQGGK